MANVLLISFSFIAFNSMESHMEKHMHSIYPNITYSSCTNGPVA